MDSFYQRLLTYYHLTEEEQRQLALPPSFASIPLLDEHPEVKKALQILDGIKKEKGKILVYGDYDTDGVMSTSILLLSLRAAGFSAEGYLPSRYLDGYGLNPENVEKIKAGGYSLIFTVDNGVSAYPALQKAQELQLPVIILDHHEFGDQQPCCAALLHPDSLSYGPIPVSAGYLSFIFSHALLQKKDDYLLTLAGLSTLSDMMPLTGYNREIVRLALEAIKKNNYPEIVALSGGAKVIDENLLSMVVIPKINAVGRLLKNHETNRLLSYFAGADESKKPALAHFLEDTNTLRKQMTKDAENKVSVDPSEEAIVVMADIPEGLNGLLANRLLQEYEKPVAVFSPLDKDPSVLVGSLRSKEGFNILKALEGQKVSLLSKGGHAFAGGVSIKAEDYQAFKKEFIFAALKHKLQKKDVSLIPLSKAECTMGNLRLLQEFGPFGMEHPAPHFLLKMPVKELTYSANGKYLSTRLSPEARLFSFSLGEDSFSLEENEVDLEVSLNLHEYLGRLSLDVMAEKA